MPTFASLSNSAVKDSDEVMKRGNNRAEINAPPTRTRTHTDGPECSALSESYGPHQAIIENSEKRQQTSGFCTQFGVFSTEPRDSDVLCLATRCSAKYTLFPRDNCFCVKAHFGSCCKAG